MMQLLEIRALGAPNLWGRVPVLDCRVVCEPVSDELIDSLFQRLQHSAQPTQLMEQRRFPTAVHALAELALLLQRQADCSVSLGEVRPTPFAHVWQMALEIEAEPIGRAALEAAWQLLSTDGGCDLGELERQLAHVRQVAEQHSLGGTTRVLASAARQRGIPILRLDGESLIQFGQGWKQHRTRMAATDHTSFIAEWISRDKLLTKSLLQRSGIPVAAGRHVHDADDACLAARELGVPVVVKPCDADFGHGVTINLTDASQIRHAYDHARKFSQRILVERYLAGYWHRLLVINGCMIAAIRKEPPQITGDGVRTVQELIAEFNADPRRGFGDRFVLDPLLIGATVLGVLYRQGFSLDSIPSAGQTVRLRQDAYLSAGATQSDVTSRVHPDIADLAVRAAEMIGLDVAGVDVICEDISRAPQDQSLGLLEVNAEPALVVHLAPVCDPPQPVGEKLIESLFPVGESGRIPVVVVVEDEPLARHLQQSCAAAGHLTGLASRAGSEFAGRPLTPGGGSLRIQVENLLMQKRLETLIIHLTIEDVLQEGLPIDRCDLCCLGVSAQRQLAAPHSPPGDQERLLQFFLQSAHWAGHVLVAREEDANRLPAIPAEPGIVFVSASSDTPEWHRHLAQGAPGITRRGQELMLESASAAESIGTEGDGQPLFANACAAWLTHFCLREPSRSPRPVPSRRSA